MQKTIITAILFIAFISNCFSQSILSDDLKTNLNARVENGMNPAIVVGIIDKGEPQYYSVGVRSLSGKESVNENTIFEIGSITKTFTAILLAQEVVDGNLKLEDPLQKFVPSSVKVPSLNGKEITLLHLANHTSSLPRLPTNLMPADPNNPYADYDEKRLFEFLSNYSLTREIGSKSEYSNYAMGLLGHVLAMTNKMTYEELMMSKIAKPLSLENTGITFSDNMKKNLATGYVGEMAVMNWDFQALAGAGAIRSSAADMIKYLKANMGITKSKLSTAMQLSHKSTMPEGSLPNVGLGWQITKAGSEEIVWHNGGTGGYRSFIGFIRGKGKAVVVLTNSNTGVDDIGMHLLNPASPLKPVAVALDLDAATMDRYVGKYELAPSFVLTIRRDDKQMRAQATGQVELPIFAKTKNTFYYRAVEAQLTFNQTAEGVVESVTLEQGGQKITGRKLVN